MRRACLFGHGAITRRSKWTWMLLLSVLVAWINCIDKRLVVVRVVEIWEVYKGCLYNVIAYILC